MKIILCGFGFVLLALSITSAWAVPVRYDITITNFRSSFGFPSGPVADGKASLTLDTELAPAINGIVDRRDYENGLPTIDFSLDWLGQHYDLSNASLWAVHIVNGRVTSWNVGGSAQSDVCAPARYGCFGGGEQDFEMHMYPNGRDGITMAIEGFEGFASGDVSWKIVDVVSVPMPGTNELLLIGIAGMFVFVFAVRKMRRN